MNSSLINLRSNKQLLYAVAGASGGAIGALFAELVRSQDPASASRIRDIIETGAWSAAFASILGTTLFVVGEWYQRREQKPGRVLKVILFGAGAGFISGAGAQFLYSMNIGSFEIKYYAFRIFAWAIMGALLGAILSRYITNLGTTRGLGAGALGGAVGCIGFLLTSMFLPGFAGRLVGVTLLGFALGLAMYFVETLFSEASVEVEWAPYETTKVGLGARPVTIGGGGEEDIFKKGLRPHISSLILKKDQIEHVETATGKRTPLQDGSRLRIGGLNMVIHAVSIGGPPTSTKGKWIAASSVSCAVLAAAIAITIAGPRPNAVAERAPRGITRLDTIGQSAKLDNSTPITHVSVHLQWRAAVDLDLSAYYDTKSGDQGVVDYSEKTGPNIQLDKDSGVGDKGGDNQENITITSLDNFKDIWFAAKIFSKGGSYSDYDAQIAIKTNNGDEIQVPLSSNERKPYLVIAELTNGPDGPNITNRNDAVTCDELTTLLGRGKCVPVTPKQGSGG